MGKLKVKDKRSHLYFHQILRFIMGQNLLKVSQKVTSRIEI